MAENKRKNDDTRKKPKTLIDSPKFKIGQEVSHRYDRWKGAVTDMIYYASSNAWMYFVIFGYRGQDRANFSGHELREVEDGDGKYTEVYPNGDE